jgi:hypothetical protein
MASQEGLLTLKGKLGRISFYKTKDGYLARQASALDAKRIQTDPAFARTRENFAEFGRAGKAGKLLRTALRPVLVNIPSGNKVSRLTQAMMKVIQADATSERGQRNVIDGEAELLLGFEFNDSAGLTSSLHAPFTSAVDRAAGTTVVNVAAFVPKEMVVSPQGATHFKLVSQAAEVDFEAETFVVSNQSTAEIPLDNQLLAPVVMNHAVTPASEHPIFLLLGIEFFQAVNGKFYSMRNGAYNALSIIDVNSGV